MRQDDRIHTLSDGRKMGYIEYGDLNGFPIFAFHGTPGSRVWLPGDDEIAKANGVRLITVDRPGYGNSDQKPGRTFVQFSDDIKELSKVLNLNKFSVVGASGGGVYSAACAHGLPNLVHKAGLISTVDEFENGKPPKEMVFVNRIVFILYPRFRWLLKYFLNGQKNTIDKTPNKYVESIRKNTKHLCESDREIIAVKENAEAILIQMEEAFKNGVAGAITEIGLFCNEWGFDPGKIQIPVELWHGTDDTLAPISAAKRLASKIPNCNENYAERKGHFLTDDEEIWKKILVSLKE